MESYGEYPRRLANDGLMPRVLAEALSRLAGLRNILVHRYLDVEVGKVYAAARGIVGRVADEFIRRVQNLISNAQ